METLPLDLWLQDLSGQAGICVALGDDGPALAHNANMPLPAASLIKLPIFLCYRLACERGELRPSQAVVFADEDIVGGCGRIQHQPHGSRFALETIAEWMLTVSDNTATNRLIDMLGMRRINAFIRQLGLGATVLERRLMDTAARDMGRENWTCPRDILTFFRTLLDPPAEMAAAAAATLAVLRRQEIGHKLPHDLPADTVVAHKTGELDDSEHDAGVIYRRGRAAIAVVMTSGLSERARGIALCRRVGAWVYARMAF